MGECGIECRTISRVCTDIFEDIEMELAEELYRGKQRADLTSTFCHIKTDACAKKPPPLTKVSSKFEQSSFLCSYAIRLESVFIHQRISG